MNIDMSSSFSAMFSFLTGMFVTVISWLDDIIVFNGFSILDLNIAFVVFGVIFTVVFSVVRSSVSVSAGDSASRRRRSERSDND